MYNEGGYTDRCLRQGILQTLTTGTRVESRVGRDFLWMYDFPIRKIPVTAV